MKIFDNLVFTGDISALARGFISSFNKNGEEYFKLDKLDLDLEIKDVKMQVRKIFNNNRILGNYYEFFFFLFSFSS